MEDFGMQKAIPMITVDQETGKYVMTPQAIQFLRSIEGPIAVVSVAGLYRTGKSYLLNRVLLNRSSGFGVGSTINACTKGLWCWGKTLRGQSNEGEDVNIIIIDTEGIGALDQDQNHDTKIFTLAILASSCFIYNSQGSIDENAIQNLSLVVNLTKHIQLKSGGQNQNGEDADEISMYFPSFFWVVRDFSLQLQDPQGNSITAKEYLERALAPQNGFTDDIQQKNRIRRLLTAFFKERDCITMIRPIVKQQDLQMLDQLSHDQLRPEFVQKALNFRKRITSTIKTKTLNNKKLNGNLYCSMMTSYVQAINNGAVPNIENAWNYMCQQQCRKSLDQCYETFMRLIEDGFRYSPKSEEQFQKIVNEAEDKALDNFRAKALGDKTSQFITQLKLRIKQRIKQRKQRNLKQSEEIMKMQIYNQVKTITKKLNKNQYSNFNEFQAQVNSIADKINKEGQKLDGFRVCRAETFKKLYTQGAQFIFKRFTKDLKSAEDLFKIKQDKYIKDMQALNTLYENLRSNSSNSISQYQRRIQTLSFKIDTLKTQLEYSKQAQQQTERKAKNQQAKSQSDFSQLRFKLQGKIDDITEKYQQINRQYKNHQNLWQKEKAIAEQNIKQKNAMIEEYNKKENKLTSQTSIERSKLIQQHKQSLLKHQRDMSNKISQLNSEKDKNNLLFEELQKLKLQHHQVLERLDQKERRFKEQSSNFKRQMQKMKKQLDDKALQYQQRYSKMVLKSKSQNYENQSKLKDIEQKFADLANRFKKQKNEMQTDIQMKKNQIKYNLQEIQNLKQSNSRLAENEKSLMATFQASFTQEKDKVLKQRMNELTNKHEQQISQINHNFETRQRQYISNIDQLTKQLEEVLNRQNQLDNYMKTKTMQSQATIKQLNQDMIKLKNGKQMQEGSRAKLYSQKQQYLRTQIKNLQDQIQQMKDTTARQRRQQMRKNQQQIATIKNSYQLQKQNLQRRLKNQKDKYQRRQNDLISQYQKRYNQETQELRDKISQLQSQNQSNSISYKTALLDLQHQNDMLRKQKNTLDKFSQDLKTSLEKRQLQFSEKEFNYNKIFKEERQKLEDKIQQMLNESNTKEKEIMNLSHQRQQLQNNLDKKQTKLLQIQRQYAREKERYENQRMKLKEMIQNKEGQLTNRIKTLEKEYALVLQEKEFRQNKIMQLQKTLSLSTSMNQEKYNKLKEEKTIELKSIEERLTNEKNTLETKYRELKVTTKQNQTSNKRAINELSKEKDALTQKMIILETKIRKDEETKVLQMSSMKREIDQLKEEKQKYQNLIQKELQRYKKQKDNLESIMNDNELRYIKEKSLAEQKIQFLDKGKSQLKKELQERIKKLEEKLETINSARMNEKSEFDSSHNESIRSVESQHRKKIQELNDSHSAKMKQLQSKLKQQENMYKELSQKSQMESLEIKMMVTNLEKKINEMNQNQRRLSSQNQYLKSQKQQKDSEYLQKEKKDRQNFRQKIQILQQKCQDAENIRKNNFYQYEKEKIKWSTERQIQDDMIQNYKDSLARSQREKEKLKEDNNRLKNDKKSSIKGHSYINSMKTIYQQPSSNKPVSKDQLNKENVIYQ